MGQSHRIDSADTEVDSQQSLGQLAVFIRLWRKLKDVCSAGYSFAQLGDICDDLRLYNSTGLSPDFFRQLAGFQMPRDQFKLALVNPAAKPAAGAIDADRTQILALWVGKSAAQWPWASSNCVKGLNATRNAGTSAITTRRSSPNCWNRTSTVPVPAPRTVHLRTPTP